MWWVFAVGHTLASEPVEVASGTLGAVGDRLAGAQITRIVRHPEFERYWLVGDSGEMVAELTRDDGVHAGLCSAAGRTLFPRPELVEGKVGRIALEPLCERMTAGVVDVAVAEAVVPEGALEPVAIAQEPRVSRGFVAAMAVAALGLAGWLSRGRRLLLGAAFVIALIVRVSLTTPALFNGGGAGYEKLRVALGLSRNEGWGIGYALWMQPAVDLYGARAEVIFSTNLVFASAWPALLAWIVDRLAGRREAWAALAVGSLLPAHLAISRSEAMHVTAVTWATLALVGAVELRRHVRAGALLMAVAGVCAIATRKDMGVLVLVLPVWIWGAPRVGRWSGGVALLALLVFSVAAGGDARAVAREVDAAALLALPLPRFGEPGVSSGYFLSAHVGFTPWLWWVLAAVGGWVTAAVRREALALAVLGAAPFVLKVTPLPDAVRLQLLAQGGLVILVAVGVVRMGRVGWLALVGGVLAGPPLSGPVWRHSEEWRFLARVVPTLAADAVVGSGDSSEAFRDVMQALGPARWTAADGATHRYRPPGAPRPGGDVLAEAEIRGVDVDRGGSAPQATRAPEATAGFYAVGE
ncbi:MAG: hypothetical protein EXR71_15225 [Myxococcales bacterium]|nr:hypothetical protein [Myxococcales bacterium]